MILNDTNSKLYIRFGDIPNNERSNVFDSDGNATNQERGVSVWDVIILDGKYKPVLPKNPSDEAITDYHQLLSSDRPIYIVTGSELSHKGTDGEPLLRDVEVVKELSKDYYK